eukprot:GHUV01015411.1.p1 GENE.GHUV01015411.1~~GHUV01015411.1.p1  ORF type:complete len:198 (+),score=46.63 GHUV01015411.1:436-1029(+)
MLQQTYPSHARPSPAARSVATLTTRVQHVRSTTTTTPVRPTSIAIAAVYSYGTKHDRCDRLRRGRLRAVPVAEMAQIGEQSAELLAILGIAFGGVFVALWNIEKQSKMNIEQELVALKDQVTAAQQQLQELQQQLAAEQQARKEAVSWKPRLDDAQTELFKLEKALEMKDAQLATFMTTAHRQIRSLEDNVKELQKM